MRCYANLNQSFLDLTLTLTAAQFRLASMVTHADGELNVSRKALAAGQKPAASALPLAKCDT